jgi:hypothetical protein
MSDETPTQEGAMARITQAQVEKAIRHAQDRERAFKEQERKAESRKKVILGGLIMLAARNIERDGLPRDKAISFFRFLASQKGVTLRDARFLAERLEDDYAVPFQQAADKLEAQDAQSV